MGGRQELMASNPAGTAHVQMDGQACISRPCNCTPSVHKWRYQSGGECYYLGPSYAQWPMATSRQHRSSTVRGSGQLNVKDWMHEIVSGHDKEAFRRALASCMSDVIGG